MKITFFSNFFNSHQLPLAREFAAMDGVEYTFVSLTQSDGIVGRESLDYEYPFVLREYEGETQAAEAMLHSVEDDVVVFGDMAGKEQYVRARAKTGKHFFRYAERLLKRGDWWRFAPPKIYRTWNWFGRYKNANMHVLCASAYTARDLEMFGFPREKCLKWGYFPDVEIYNGRKKELQGYKSLCSAQRLIALKRVELQVQLASRLKNEGYKFTLKIAGDGPEREKLEQLSSDLNVDDCIQFLGELSHDEIIQLMRDSEIFLATSNRKEGWGATINEAMASGCCVVASDAMGAAPFLIDNEKNGLLYKSDSLENLISIVKKILDNEVSSCKIALQATKTISENWNARNVASRFISLCMGCMAEAVELNLHSNGPLSLSKTRFSD